MSFINKVFCWWCCYCCSFYPEKLDIKSGKKTKQNYSHSIIITYQTLNDVEYPLPRLVFASMRNAMRTFWQYFLFLYWPILRALKRQQEDCTKNIHNAQLTHTQEQGCHGTFCYRDLVLPNWENYWHFCQIGKFKILKYIIRRTGVTGHL